jgi:hypothetical protein
MNAERLGVRRVVAGLPAAGLVAAAALAASAPANAAVLPTKTVVSFSAATISPTQSATATAVVGRLGLGITPSGTVTFTDSTNGTPLGQATLTRCIVLISSCTASVTVPGSVLATDDNVIVASYSGDSLSKASSGSGDLFGGTTTDCAANTFCEAFAGSTDGSSSLDVTVAGTDTPQSITIGFGDSPLSCSTPGTGDTAGYQLSNPNVPKTLDFTSYGDAADAAQAAHPISSLSDDAAHAYVCFGAPKSFTTKNGLQSKKQDTGEFQGVLPACKFVGENSTATNPPCIASALFIPGNDGPDEYDTVVQVPAGDPHITH